MTPIVILAGGRSSRMGQDKLRLEFQGETLLCRAYRRFTGTFERVYISAADDELASAPPEAEILRDVIPGLGPISGLHAALLRFDNVFLVAADMPFAEPKYARGIISALIDGGGDAVAASREDRPEPLFAAYSRAALSETEKTIQSGDYSLRRMLARLDARFVETPPETLLNINRPDDYERLVKESGAAK